MLELLTDQPGLQFYSGNYLDGSIPGKRGRLYRQSDAICLEPQVWPDTPNRPDFPSARLTPDTVYRHHTVYRFFRRARRELMDEVPVSVLCSERCHLGEGPSYDAATDTAWWFDILEAKTVRGASGERGRSALMRSAGWQARWRASMGGGN